MFATLTSRRVVDVREGCLCKKKVKRMCYHFSVGPHDNPKSRNRTAGQIGGTRVLSPLHHPCSPQSNTWSFQPITCKESVIFMIIREIHDYLNCRLICMGIILKAVKTYKLRVVPCRNIFHSLMLH